MSFLEKIISRKPPEIIYHYTSQSGFLGIIRNKSIWATKAQYQNDSKEFQHALDLSKIVIYDIEDKVSPEEERLLRLMKRGLERIQNINTFVCSFSEHEDLLSQWRGYCPKGSGLSLRFDYSILTSIVKKQGFDFFPCIYDISEQRQIILEIIETILENFRNDLENSVHIKLALENRSNEYITRMYSVAPIIKHSTFSEEGEWRAVSVPVDNNHPQIAFREGTSMLIPYFNIKFNNEEPLKRIKIGPTPHKELSMSSVVGFLSLNNLGNYEVSFSQIPFRNW